MTIAVRHGISMGSGRACVLATTWPVDPDAPPSTAVTFVGPAGVTGGYVLNRHLLYGDLLEEKTGELLVGTCRGQFVRILGEETSEESIIDLEEGPMVHGMLTCIRRIGRHVYAVGMGRQLYRRAGTGAWERFDRDSLDSLENKDNTGFNAIDGPSEDRIAAAGFNGEIWLWTEGRGRPVKSPTSVLLYDLRWLTPDVCLACGQLGTIVRGEGDAWTLLKHDHETAEFGHLEVFRDAAYFTSPSGIFVLRPDRPLELIDTLPDSERFHLLHARGGALWAFGSKYMAWTVDAKSWQVFEFKLPTG